MPRTTNHVKSASNFKDVLARLGNIPLERVRAHPAPGTATERDVVQLEAREGLLCELVDGVLVEKAMGAGESFLTLRLAHFLGRYLDENDIGYLLGADGLTRLFPGHVRIPDVSFTSWNKQSAREGPSEAITPVIPNLIVEVVSESNTRQEMERKRKDYFMAGVELVWQIDRNKRTVEVYAAPDVSTTLLENDTVTGGAVLPGFSLHLKDLFARVPKAPTRRVKKRGTS